MRADHAARGAELRLGDHAPAPAQAAALAALYAYARRVDDIADGGRGARAAREHSRSWAAVAEPCRGVRRTTRARRARRHGRSLPDAEARLARAHRRERSGTSTAPVTRPGRSCASTAAGRRRGGDRVHGGLRARDPAEAVPLAETLGLALQQINIMRDVPEDWRSVASTCRRTSWPASGSTEDDIAAGGRARLARADGAPGRARDASLAEGLGSCPLLDARARSACERFAGIYAGLLGRDRARTTTSSRAAEPLGVRRSCA